MHGITEWRASVVIDDIQKKSNEAARKGAKIVAAKAQRNHAFKNITGRLERSIKAKKSKFKDGGWIVRAGGKGAKQAPLLELGTTRIRPMFYLRHALEDSRTDIRRLFKVR